LGEALVDGVEDGQRRGPALVRLAATGADEPRYAALSAFRLPGNERRVSCALTLADPPPASGRLEGGLHDRDSFEASARELIENAQARGAELELGLVELGGLADRKARLPADEASALLRRVVGALRAESVDDLATELGEDRFAVLRRRGDAPEDMARRLSRVLGAALKPRAHAFAVNTFADSTRMMRAP
jgi:hypothetical protein